MGLTSDEELKVQQMEADWKAREAELNTTVSERKARLRQLVFDRDQWVCWLCEFPVLRDAVGVMAATLDHVVPRGLNGAETPENLRCAHWHCNHERGVRDPTDDLRAVLRDQIGEMLNTNEPPK